MAEQHDDQIDSANGGARKASVQLRDRGQTVRREQHKRMDAANESLADALRITYKLLQGGMVVLVLLYLVSGFQSINEGERGIAVRFGKIVKQKLDPGFQWSWPYPIGEIVRVSEGSVEVPVGSAFMPNLSRGNNNVDKKYDLGYEQYAMGAALEEFGQSRRLDPATNGSNITADLNIAHSQWRVYYRRSNHADLISNILPEQEDELVRVATERGVVQSVATISIDDLLKNSNEAVSSRVREIAQRTLDGLNSGITIDRVVLARKSPPMSLEQQFSYVQAAAQNAGKAREDALLTREQTLNDIAGSGSDILIAQINEFERYTEIGDTVNAEKTLAVIDRLLIGESVEIDGVLVMGQSSGLVSEMINEAVAISSAKISQAIAEYQIFEAKQRQFEANPSLMIARDWSSAMAEFLEKDFVSSIMLPQGVSVEMLINNDPEIEKRIARQQRTDLGEEARDNRIRGHERDVFRSRRGIQEDDK